MDRHAVFTYTRVFIWGDSIVFWYNDKYLKEHRSPFGKLHNVDVFVSGQRGGTLPKMKSEIKKTVMEVKPNIVAVSIGTNDVCGCNSKYTPEMVAKELEEFLISLKKECTSISHLVFFAQYPRDTNPKLKMSSMLPVDYNSMLVT